MLAYKEIGFRYLPGQAAPSSGALQQAYIHKYTITSTYITIVLYLATQA